MNGRLLEPTAQAKLSRLQTENDPNYIRMMAQARLLEVLNKAQSRTGTSSYGVLRSNAPTTTTGPDTADDATIYADE